MSEGNINFITNGLDGLLLKNDSSDYLQYGEFVPLNSVSSFKKGDQFQVSVCEVVSPAEFWLHIHEASGNTLKKMVDDMNVQYDEKDAGALPSNMIPVRGLQFCAVKTDDIWYRVVVIGEPTSDGNIMIRRVDFGSVDLVPMADLRPLRRQWASLPMQAMRAQLTKLLPTLPGEDAWSPEQSEAFSAMVTGGALIATVTAVNNTVNTLHLYLLDPTTGLYINCELVKHLASNVVNSLAKPTVPPIPPPGISRFISPELPQLPFNDLPIWRQDCHIFVELNKTDPQKALEFITTKIEDILQVAYAVI